MDLPCEECGGQCCTFPAMTKPEFRKIKAVHGVPKGTTIMKNGPMIVLYDEKGDCPYLKDGRCSVYPLRPDTCRKYGKVKKMPCQYLYPNEAEKAAEGMLERMK